MRETGPVPEEGEKHMEQSKGTPVIAAEAFPDQLMANWPPDRQEESLAKISWASHKSAECHRLLN